MYKIYINGNCLLIADHSSVLSGANDHIKTVPFLGNHKSLLNYIDKLEKSQEQLSIALLTPDPAQLFMMAKSLYKSIKAAGGVIYNESGEILFIERLGVWDLPKGKKDKGEKTVETALREVEEETGLVCHVGEKAGATWHTYHDQHNRRILKKTVWYTMNALPHQPVVIQESENITAYRWISAKDFLKGNLATYPSIKEIIGKVVPS